MHPAIAIVTASYLNSPQRFASAELSLRSLIDSAGAEYEIFVVDDIPRWGKGVVKSHLPDYRSYGFGKTLYGQQGITLKRRYGRGSRSALLEATAMAERAGYEQVFIHLDDNVYLPVLSELLRSAADAMAKQNSVKIVKFVGYPLLTHATELQLGNRTFIEVRHGTVCFDEFMCEPVREERYTLWHMPLSVTMCRSSFWPIGLWSAVYDTSFLKTVLTHGPAESCLHLAEVEMVYRDPAVWEAFLNQHTADVGFINMQFCGFETEHNENWPLLIQSPNQRIP